MTACFSVGVLLMSAAAEAQPTPAQRFSVLLDQLELSETSTRRALEQIQALKPRFDAWLDRLDASREAPVPGTSPVEWALETEAARGAARSNVVEGVTAALHFVETPAAHEGLGLLYRYLRDELWYRGLVTRQGALTHPARAFVIAEPTNPSELSPGSSEEELREQLEQMLKDEGEPGEPRDAAERRPNPPEPASREPDSIVPRPAEEIVEEDPHEERGAPPWSEMPLTPATPETLRHFLLDESLPVVQFTWRELAPVAIEALAARLEARPD